MGPKFFLFVIALWAYIMFNYHPEYICKRDCDKLKYKDLCYKQCENEHDQRRYIHDVFGKKEKIPDYIPSKVWYELTSTHRNAFDEHNGIYLSVLYGPDYIVKYIKVKQSYIEQSPWKQYYEKENYAKMINRYDWYIPAYSPLFFLSVVPNKLDKTIPIYYVNKTSNDVAVKIMVPTAGHLVTDICTIYFSKCNKYNFVIFTSYEHKVASIPFFGKLKKY